MWSRQLFTTDGRLFSFINYYFKKTVVNGNCDSCGKMWDKNNLVFRSQYRFIQCKSYVIMPSIWSVAHNQDEDWKSLTLLVQYFRHLTRERGENILAPSGIPWQKQPYHMFMWMSNTNLVWLLCVFLNNVRRSPLFSFKRFGSQFPSRIANFFFFIPLCYI